MIDVAIVTPRYPSGSAGGGERSSKLLATQLATQDRIDRVTVFTFDGKDTTYNNNVEIHRLGPVSSFLTEYQNLAAYRRLRTRLGSFDIIHAYNMELHPVAGYLSEKLDVPSVATLNSYHFFPSDVSNTTATRLQRFYERVGHPTTGRVLRHFMKQIDAFIALSEAIRGIYCDNGFTDSRIEHIPNMIDPEFNVPTTQSDGRYLLYVGSLTENKGVKYLVEALLLLPDTYHIRVVGDGDRSDVLRELARDLDVTDRIEFSGRIPYYQISDAYANAEMFVHPGIWPEPLNRTVLEAMQAGLLVVCTDIGGPPEVIPDKELLCEPANPAALAETIERARGLEQRRNLGELNRERIREQHAPPTIVPQIIDLYEDLLDTK
jgi:glycosyltransferase involved in cell wall biosynthesis